MDMIAAILLSYIWSYFQNDQSFRIDCHRPIYSICFKVEGTDGWLTWDGYKKDILELERAVKAEAICKKHKFDYVVKTIEGEYPDFSLIRAIGFTHYEDAITVKMSL